MLARDRRSVFGPTQHPVIDTAACQAVLDQVRAAATGEGPVRPDVAVVLARRVFALELPPVSVCAWVACVVLAAIADLTLWRRFRSRRAA